MNWKNINYMASWEFACKHCRQEIAMDMFLVSGIDWLRMVFDVPVSISSGYRCPVHNANEGGAKNSFHLRGLAADVRVRDPRVMEGIYKVAIISNKFNGVGYSQEKQFVHLDTRSDVNVRYVYLPGGGTRPLNPDILAEIKRLSVRDVLRSIEGGVDG